MASPSPPPAFDAHGTIGALELGVFFSCVLFGLETMQSYIYFCRFAADTLRLKLLVAGVWLLEVAHVISISRTLYMVSVTDYGNPELAQRVPAALAVSMLFSGLILAAVQGYFTERIYRTSRVIFVPIVCGVLTFLRLVGFIVIFAFALHVQSTASWQAQYAWLLDTVWAISTVNDITLAVALSYTLVRERRQAEKKRETLLVDQALEWIVETGALTSATGIVVLVTFVTVKNKYIWIASYFITAKLYSNAFFSHLNSRYRPQDAYSDRDVVLSDINASELEHNPNARLAPMVFAAPAPRPDESQFASPTRVSNSFSFSLDHDSEHKRTLSDP